MPSKEQYFETTFEKVKECILSINKDLEKDIYALSFWKDNVNDDPHHPIITIGYNTTSHFKTQIPQASDENEAKWNFAFWLQNELLCIESNRDNDHLHNEEDNIQSQFIEMIIKISRKLHNENIISQKFGGPIPILIHELEYYDLPINWTTKANPKELITDWLQFANES